jgi:hypothetical protein
MIKNLWNQTTFLCGCHKDRVPLEYNAKGETMFYSCPRYLHHDETERACRNNLSFYNAEKILDKLSAEIAKNDHVDLTNYQFDDRGIHVKVAKLTDKECELEITNHKSLS